MGHTVSNIYVCGDEELREKEGDLFKVSIGWFIIISFCVTSTYYWLLPLATINFNFGGLRKQILLLNLLYSMSWCVCTYTAVHIIFLNQLVFHLLWGNCWVGCLAHRWMGFFSLFFPVAYCQYSTYVEGPPCLLWLYARLTKQYKQKSILYIAVMLLKRVSPMRACIISSWLIRCDFLFAMYYHIIRGTGC